MHAEVYCVACGSEGVIQYLNRLIVKASEQQQFQCQIKRDFPNTCTTFYNDVVFSLIPLVPHRYGVMEIFAHKMFDGFQVRYCRSEKSNS